MHRTHAHAGGSLSRSSSNAGGLARSLSLGSAGTTPRHRRPTQQPPSWPDPVKEQGAACSGGGGKAKRSHTNTLLMLLLVTMAGAICTSVVLFSSSGAGRRQAGGEWRAAGAPPSRRSLSERLRQREEAASGQGDWWETFVPEEQQQQGVHQPSPYQRAVAECSSLGCLAAAARQPRYRGQFLFPHFMIVGWQKCATTSLYHHLKTHPRVLTPIEKEVEFFSYECSYQPLACPPDKQERYIQESLNLKRVLRHNLYKAMYEGSTHYAREGARMAAGLRQTLPWLRLVASMREPISRYLSMLGHNLDKNTYTCLRKQKDLFSCLELELPMNNYTEPIQSWLAAFPPQQLMVVQYESLISEERQAEHLKAVRTFLGLVRPGDPQEPLGELPAANTRAARLGQEPEGWKMLRWQYERLIEVVRPDATSIAAIVEQHGLGDGQQWMANWEAAWAANLAACGPGPDGECSVR